jgi:hypothetical protein
MPLGPRPLLLVPLLSGDLVSLPDGRCATMRKKSRLGNAVRSQMRMGDENSRLECGDLEMRS